MEEAKEVVLESGSTLSITMAPFSVSKALYMAVCEEMKSLKIDSTDEIDANFWKDLFCTGLSSKKIELALTECMKRTTYNGLRITESTWEPVKAREDYLMTCFEVAQENLKPFTKNLFAQYAVIFQKLKSTLA